MKEGGYGIWNGRNYVDLSDQTIARLDKDAEGWREYPNMDKNTDQAKRIESVIYKIKQEIIRCTIEASENGCDFYEY